MSTQQKSSGGGRKNKAVAGQKDVAGVAVSEQNNNQTQINSKKQNVNSKDAGNNNAADQSKSEKEKQHVKVSYSYYFSFALIDLLLTKKIRSIRNLSEKTIYC